MERCLLLRAGEGPGCARALLLPEREAQLLGRPQPLGTVRAERSHKGLPAPARTRGCAGRSSPRTSPSSSSPCQSPCPSHSRLSRWSRRESNGPPCREQGGARARLRKCGGSARGHPALTGKRARTEAHAAGERLRRLTRHRIPSGRMRILVTGVSGFAGAALVPRLREDGHELRGFSATPLASASTCPSSSATRSAARGSTRPSTGSTSPTSSSTPWSAATMPSRHARPPPPSASSRPPGERVCAGWCISVGSCPPPMPPRRTCRVASPSRRRCSAASRRRSRCERRSSRHHVAIVPLPRAPRGAHPGHPAAGLARASHPSYRPARRRRAARGRRDDRARHRRPVARHRRPRRRDVRRAHRPHPRGAHGRPPVAAAPGAARRASAASPHPWPPRSPARTPTSSARSWRRWRATCCRATTAPRTCSASSCTRSTGRSFARALRDWESVESSARTVKELERARHVVSSSHGSTSPPRPSACGRSRWTRVPRRTGSPSCATSAVGRRSAGQGFRMDQQLRLRGVTFKVEWTLQEVEPPFFARWEGKGPARARAIIEDRLTPTETGTHFDYRNEFHTPFGPMAPSPPRPSWAAFPCTRRTRRSPR